MPNRLFKINGLPGFRFLATLLSLLTVVALVACSESAPPSQGGPIAMKRLTQIQYRQAIADIFGSDIELFGRIEPDYRHGRLLAVGSAQTSVGPSGFEQYEKMARGIASQVLDEGRSDRFVTCRPGDITAADDACAAKFVRELGRKLFRRPLTDKEVQARVDIAAEATATLGGFYKGLEYALTSLLTSPEFLFRVEVAESDPDNPDARRLDSFSKASRLSYLLWNAAPDDELLDAAENGALHSRKGLLRQVERMMRSERLEDGIRALFSDMLQFDRFDEVSKDSTIYPAYTSRVAADAQQQTLRFIIDHLLEQDGDYRDLFTARSFPMTRPLGRVYGVPVEAAEGWDQYRFADDAGRAGLLSQISVLALHSHPGRSSPTLRGKFIRETFMCQQVPAPPADVDFTMDKEFEVLKTARERLDRHRTDPACNGCHQLMDPIGLTLEKFDGIGAPRQRENGAIIDVSGELDGVTFEGAAGLGRAIHDHPAVPACLVETVFRYAAGREPMAAERDFMKYLEERFSESGYNVKDLLRTIATSKAFYAVSEPSNAES